MKIKNDFLIKNWLWLFPCAYFLVFIVYVLFNGENVFVAVPDLLDDKIPVYKMLRDGKLWFSNKPMPYLHSEYGLFVHCSSFLKFQSLFYILLPTFWAFIALEFFKVVIAMAGGLFLGKVCFEEKFPIYRNIVMFVSFIYGILPLQPMEVMGLATMPALLGLLVLLYKTNDKRLLLLVFIYPYFSTFSFFGIFICGYILLFFIIDAIVHKKAKWIMLAALVCISLGYIIGEYKLFYQMLFQKELVSLRSSSYATSDYSIMKIIKECLMVFKSGYWHASSLQEFVVLPVCLIRLFVSNFIYIKNGEKRRILSDKFNWLFAWFLFNIFLYGLDSFEPFKKFVALICPPLSGFSFARGIWFNPFIIYAAFCVVLCELAISKKKLPYVIAILALLVVPVGSKMYNIIYRNLKNQMFKILGKTERVDLTYAEFFSEKLFEKIKNEIGYNGEWSVAYGMHPGILYYNGISTLDGYHSYYSENYKQKFRKIIAPELEIDDENRKYFDDWGGRAYIFSPDIKYSADRKMPLDSAPLYISRDAFVELEGKYVFSRVEISNAKELGFDFVGSFSDDLSPYIIWVYKQTTHLR